MYLDIVFKPKDKNTNGKDKYIVFALIIRLNLIHLNLKIVLLGRKASDVHEVVESAKLIR